MTLGLMELLLMIFNYLIIGYLRFFFLGFKAICKGFLRKIWKRQTLLFTLISITSLKDCISITEEVFGKRKSRLCSLY